MIHIIEKIENYDPDSILLFEKIKNNIINDGYFIKINYSKPNFVLNGIYLQIPLSIISVENNYNLKIHFDVNKNKNIIKKIKDIEMEILQKISIDKMGVYKIYDQIKNGTIKLFLMKNEMNSSGGSGVSSGYGGGGGGENNNNNTTKYNNHYPFSSSSSLSSSSSSSLSNFSPNRFSQQFINQNINIMLKISGIWITDGSYGLSYKFLFFKHLLPLDC